MMYLMIHLIYNNKGAISNSPFYFELIVIYPCLYALKVYNIQCQEN